MKIKRLGQSFKTMGVDRENYRIDFILSSPEEDRHGDEVYQPGWITEAYKQNPVVLWGHNQSIPAIGKVLPESLMIKDGNLVGTVQFAYKESALAKEIFELCAGGYINACSVGFRNLKWQYDETREVFILLENELYELSIVNVPANARALANNKGIETPILNGMDDLFTKTEESLRTLITSRKDELGEQVQPEEDKIEPPKDDTVVEEDVVQETSGEIKPDDTAELPTEEEIKHALNILFKADNKTMRDCVKELTDRLNQSPATDTDEKSSNKKSVKNINRVIRNLLNSKSGK